MYIIVPTRMVNRETRCLRLSFSSSLRYPQSSRQLEGRTCCIVGNDIPLLAIGGLAHWLVDALLFRSVFLHR